MQRIGVRELRQNASRYLKLVKAGATIEVTERGRAVALLTPTTTSRWDAMVTSGEVREPVADATAVQPPRDYGVDASGALHALREDER